MTTRPVPAVAAVALLALGLAACGSSSDKKQATTPAATTDTATLVPSACPKAAPLAKQIPAAGSYSQRKGAVLGAIEASQRLGANAVVCGWAAGAKDHRPAATVVIFAGGKPIAAVRPTLPRPDVVKSLKVRGLDSGFSASFPASALGGASSVKVLGIEGGTASDLPSFGCGKATHDLDCKTGGGTGGGAAKALGTAGARGACPAAASTVDRHPKLTNAEFKHGDPVIGAVDATQLRGREVAVCGWGAGRRDHRAATRFVILSGLTPIAAVAPSVDRPDVVKGLGVKDVRSGFSVRVPLSAVTKGGRRVPIAVLAIEGGRAGRIKPDGCTSAPHDFDC